MKVVPIDSNELDNLSPSSLFKSICFFGEKEKDNILNKILMAKGGSLNFDTIFKISELAIFLPSLKRITNFLITRFSIHYE